LTAQGSPRARFRRAIERGNVVVAEATAREFGLSLEEALEEWNPLRRKLIDAMREDVAADRQAFDDSPGAEAEPADSAD
jgi:hypothetical protein